MEQIYYGKCSNLMLSKLVLDFEENNGAKLHGFMHNFHRCSLSFICFSHFHTSFDIYHKNVPLGTSQN